MWSFLGSWKEWVLANISASGAGCAVLGSWRVLIICSVMCLSPLFHNLVQNSLCREFWWLVSEGSLPWRLKHCKISNLRVLKWVNWVMFQIVPLHGVLKWVDLRQKTPGVLKGVIFDCKTQGSWNESISDILPYMLLHRVLKGVNSRCKTQGSWKESISDVLLK